jgi:DNA gyrase/topoisomerase IV subunit A
VDELIPRFYRSYGMYVNHSRMLPLSNDGLRPAERRVLLSAYEIAKDKLVKNARIDGHAIGHYSPHGSCYGTIVQMYHQNFLEGQGNFGTYVGVENDPAAAMRYTECKLAKKTLDMAIKLIDYVPWEESELDNEPVYLPTMFPFCLLGTRHTTGIGFGYKAYVPCFKMEDLHKRLLFLLGKTKDKPIIKPISDCTILATDEEIEQLLTTGKASIKIQGIVKVDKIHCKAMINSWSPGRKFEAILSKFEKELNNQDVGWIDLSTTTTKIVFEVIKQRNRDEIFTNFVAKLQKELNGSIPFEMIIVDKAKNVKLMSVDQMLLNTYNLYKNTNIVMLNSEIERYKKNIAENMLLSKIKPLLSVYLKTDTPVVEIIEKISLTLKVDDNIIKDLFQKYNIRKLLTVKDDVTELTNKLNQTREYLKEIDEFVISQYQNIV